MKKNKMKKIKLINKHKKVLNSLLQIEVTL
jgi:hypothetical protein